MFRPTRSARLVQLLAVAAGFVAGAEAQSSGWVAGQNSSTMCYWEQLRASVVRDTLYLDGGALWWLRGFNNGSFGDLSNDNNPLGIVYTLNFSVPFNTSSNFTALLGTLFKTNGGAANNIAPNYYDGAMLANDDEWFLYGGLLDETDAFSPPHSDDVLSYQADQYGVNKPSFRPGFLNDVLPSGMTRYLAYGGAANAPSENKAWYFSGMHSPSWGPIYTVSGNDSITAINVSNTLIELNMAVQQQEKWSNTTFSDVSGRANPELVWVPVGSQGILVAIGGVVYPEFVEVFQQSSNEAASKAQSPAFITTIDVYDVANGTWYKQPTTGGGSIGQLTRGCAVLATASDASSFNIYYYGGYDGLDVSGNFNDDVWVLSLPSFTWTKVSSGTPSHARAGHKCATPYPDQMFVVGGYTTTTGVNPACVGGNIVQLFNLSSAQWMTSYTPTKWSNYTVPDAVVSVIGGNGKGGATATAPAASGWATPALGEVFATPYPKSKLTTYYPYPLASTTDNTNPSLPTQTSSSGSGGVPKYLPPLLGVICGLILLTAIAVAIVLYRRRRYVFFKGSRSGGRRSSGMGRGGATNTESVASTYDTGRNFVFSWLRAQPSVKQASTGGSTSYDDPHGGSNGHDNVGYSFPSSGTPVSPGMAQMPGSPGYFALHPHQAQRDGSLQPTPAVEADSRFISEMIADTAHPAELPGELPGTIPSSTDVSSGALFGRGPQSGGGGGSTVVPSSTAELESPVMNHSSAASNSSRQPGVAPRPDSPSLGAAPSQLQGPLVQPEEAQPGPHQLVQSPVEAPGAAVFAPAPAPTPSSAARFRESNISELSEQDRRHLRQGSEASAASGLSSPGPSAVSPLGGGFPSSITGAAGATPPAAPQPQPIPEAEVGAEAQAEAEASAAAAEGSSPAQAHLGTPTAGDISPGQQALRRSVFRESEEDMKE